MVVGWLAQFVLRRDGERTDWTMAIVAGLGGSFVGGLLASLIAGDGIDLAPCGLIGSIVGAIVITAGWQWYATRKAKAARKNAKKASRSGRHH
jgi:uncharacterized membrane protein YeaQ/YmgE (transglycosylase-associated protein family)